MSWKAKRYQDRNRHHLTPRSRGGKNTPDNLLLINIEKHVYWHKIFKNKTLEEVIGILTRLQRMKERKCIALIATSQSRRMTQTKRRSAA